MDKIMVVQRNTSTLEGTWIRKKGMEIICPHCGMTQRYDINLLVETFPNFRLAPKIYICDNIKCKKSFIIHGGIIIKTNVVRCEEEEYGMFDV